MFQRVALAFPLSIQNIPQKDIKTHGFLMGNYKKYSL
jgi:hypothetical protein